MSKIMAATMVAWTAHANRYWQVLDQKYYNNPAPVHYAGDHHHEYAGEGERFIHSANDFHDGQMTAEESFFHDAYLKYRHREDAKYPHIDEEDFHSHGGESWLSADKYDFTRQNNLGHYFTNGLTSGFENGLYRTLNNSATINIHCITDEDCTAHHSCEVVDSANHVSECVALSIVNDGDSIANLDHVNAERGDFEIGYWCLKDTDCQSKHCA